MKKTGLRFLKYALAGVLLLPSLTSLAFADDPQRISEEYLKVKDGYKLTFKLPDALEEAEVTDFRSAGNYQLLVDVYKVAEAKQFTGYDTYLYESDSVISGLSSENKALLTDYAKLQTVTREKWNEIAVDAAKNVKPADKVTTEPVAFTGTSATLDLNTLEKLERGSGLYLIVPHDAAHTDPLTNDKNHSVAFTTLYEYEFMPQLISLPTPADTEIAWDKDWKIGDSEDETAFNQYTIKTDPDESITDEKGIKTWMAAEGGWQKTMDVVLKPARKQRFSKLYIEKFIDVYENSSPVTFVFDVVSQEIDPETKRPLYSNVAAITFNAPGTRYTVLDHIPVGLNVTVTEKTKPNSEELNNGYKAVTNEYPLSQELKITPEDQEIAKAHFENTYNNKIIHGYGIENRFTKDDNGWSDPQYGDNKDNSIEGAAPSVKQNNTETETDESDDTVNEAKEGEDN